MFESVRNKVYTPRRGPTLESMSTDHGARTIVSVLNLKWRQAMIDPYAEVDAEVQEALDKELGRQRTTIELIASENFQW